MDYSARLSLGWRGSARHWSNYEKGVPHSGGHLDAAGALGSLHRQASTFATSVISGLAHDDLPAVLSSQALYSRVSPW